MQAETKQRREKPDLPREIYSIREYLQIIGQSRAEFYKEQKLGLGPLTIPMGRRKRGILAEDLRAVLARKRQEGEAQRLAKANHANAEPPKPHAP
jgi:hypothetical protein